MALWIIEHENGVTYSMELPHDERLLTVKIKFSNRRRQKVKVRRAMLRHWRRVYCGEEVNE